MGKQRGDLGVSEVPAFCPCGPCFVRSADESSAPQARHAPCSRRRYRCRARFIGRCRVEPVWPMSHRCSCGRS